MPTTLPTDAMNADRKPLKIHETENELKAATQAIEALWIAGNRPGAEALATTLPLAAYARGKEPFVAAFSSGFRTDAAALYDSITGGDATAETLAAEPLTAAA